MAFTGQQVFLYKRTLQNLFPGNRRCCCLKYLLVLLVFLVSSASSSEAQAERCVSQPIDGTCSPNHFYDSTNSCCIQCRNCSALNLVVLYQCNATHDTKCIPSCPNPELQRWSIQDNKCIITDCTKCEGGNCMNGIETCLCHPCHTGATCTELIQTEACGADITSTDRNPESEGTTLNPLTIGLSAGTPITPITNQKSLYILYLNILLTLVHIS